MALTYSKQLYLYLSKYGKRNLLPALGSNVPSVAHYSDASTTKVSKEKLSKAMKAYLEKAIKYDKFMKQQLEEYNLGKKFLENMMGRKSEMTQKDIDEAIDYLFPSALYVPKARPVMKPPDQIFSKHKDAFFDTTGRPFHFLFYTVKPNYSQCLHDAASLLESLNEKAGKKETPEPLVLPIGKWCTKEKLEKIFLEKLFDLEYEKFVEVFTALAEHPYAQSAEKFIKQYWNHVESSVHLDVPVPIVNEDGVKIIKVQGLRKKLCEATVTVKYPGKGDIRINNLGIDYFENMQRREQVSPGKTAVSNVLAKILMASSRFADLTSDEDLIVQEATSRR